VKRVCREVLSCLLSPQQQDKKWKELLLQFVKFLLSIPLPLELEPFIVEIISERIFTSENSFQLFASLKTILLVLSTESALQISGWVPQSIALVGRLLEIIATRDNPKILSKSVHQILLVLRR
jgi:hypothetical protein